jgi:hypothetical protein
MLNRSTRDVASRSLCVYRREDFQTSAIGASRELEIRRIQVRKPLKKVSLMRRLRGTKCMICHRRKYASVTGADIIIIARREYLEMSGHHVS